MARSRSSKRWLAEHFEDEYVRRAQREGLRSRSAFKLLELQEKYGLIEPGITAVDLGAAPGGWCQVVQAGLGGSGKLIAVDILGMEPLPGVQLICGDFSEEGTLRALETALGGRGVDLVLSDMAPNMSGMTTVDQAKAMHLAELALEFAREHLNPGGDFVVKLFQGPDFDGYVRKVRTLFDNVLVRKPKASRPRSREVYLLARGHQVQ